MPDEAAWEDSSLGHGIFTYCWSVRSQAIGATGALGIQSDNSFGPALSIAEGAFGCAILTRGGQNPVIFDAYQLEACGEEVEIWPESEDSASTPLTADEMRGQLLAIRDRFKADLAPLNRRRGLV